MNLTDVLDLVGILFTIAALAALVLILVPWPWALPAALLGTGVLITLTSLLISKRGAR